MTEVTMRDEGLRFQAALEMAEAMGGKELFKDIFELAADNYRATVEELPKELGDRLLGLINRGIEELQPAMIHQFALAYAQRFTVEELNEVRDFHLHTAGGRKLVTLRVELLKAVNGSLTGTVMELGKRLEAESAAIMAEYEG